MTGGIGYFHIFERVLSEMEQQVGPVTAYLGITNIVMACVDFERVLSETEQRVCGIAYVVMVYAVMAYGVMVWVVIAYIVMAHVVMSYVVIWPM